jgi:hypothetical protein
MKPNPLHSGKAIGLPSLRSFSASFVGHCLTQLLLLRIPSKSCVPKFTSPTFTYLHLQKLSFLPSSYQPDGSEMVNHQSGLLNPSYVEIILLSTFGKCLFDLLGLANCSVFILLLLWLHLLWTLPFEYLNLVIHILDDLLFFGGQRRENWLSQSSVFIIPNFL